MAASSEAVGRKRSDVDKPLLPLSGERVFVTGQTGSGKTAFIVWLLARMTQSPVMIYDTKEEDKYLTLPDSLLVSSQAEADDAFHNAEYDYIIVRPPVAETSEPEVMDAYLLHHYEAYSNCVAVVDEAYQFHRGGRAFPGLIALMTRGRARGLTTIMCTQRPAWISKFLISESQKFYVFYLMLSDDRKRMDDIVPDFSTLPDPPKFGFYFLKAGERKATKYSGVKLDKMLNVGYTDEVPEPLTPSDLQGPGPRKRGVVWL